MTQVTARQQVKERVAEVLRLGGFGELGDVIDVSDGDDIDDLFVVIISPRFEGLRPSAKNDLIWSILLRDLKPEEWGLVSLTIGVTPDEVNGATLEDIKMM